MLSATWWARVAGPSAAALNELDEAAVRGRSLHRHSRLTFAFAVSFLSMVLFDRGSGIVATAVGTALGAAGATLSSTSRLG
jgi:hypothetical protein